MLESNETALLPEGLHDCLWDNAEFENRISQKLLTVFNSYGFRQVVPPLLEFEESLLSGPAKKHSRHMFRVMDPMSQRMMAVRSDMTGQVARIARTRLKNYPRPLRMSYMGDVLRVKGSQLRPERQFIQTGVELIGSDSSDAYIEVILLAREALVKAGVTDLSIDLIYPKFVPAVFAELGVSGSEICHIRDAVNAKDIGELSTFDGKVGQVARALLKACGSADKALAKLSKIDLPATGEKLLTELKELVAKLKQLAPDLNITIDLGEYKDFEYHTGMAFTFFALNVRGELGRGGRYLVNAEIKDGKESATGFSLYLDSLMRALPEAELEARIFIPFKDVSEKSEEISKLRDQGFRTIQSLKIEKDETLAAKTQGCSHIWQDGQIVEI